MTLDRLKDWQQFSDQVEKHIVQYTIPQYQDNDAETDQIGIWTVEDCINAIKKYVARAGTELRGPVESQRDLLKIAHYAQFAYDKFTTMHDLTDIYAKQK